MKFLFALLLAGTVAAHAATPCDPMMPYGQPVPNYPTQQLCRTSYFMLHNNATKTGGLAIEVLDPQTVGSGKEPRTNNFRADIEVPAASRARPADYADTGFDKGHLAPAGDMPQDGKSMSQSFFMSNMAPQRPGFNRGIWRVLETEVRDMAHGGRKLHVLTGTTFATKFDVIGNEVGVPTNYFKVIIDKQNRDVAAYLIPNVAGKFRKLIAYKMTLGQLQAYVGYDLIPGATAAERAVLLNATGSTLPIN